MTKLICRPLLVAVMLAVLVSFDLPTVASPLSPGGRDGAIATSQQGLVMPAATRLCGRGLGGRCTRGRSACAHGTKASCDKWTAWSKACSKCAAADSFCWRISSLAS